MSVYPSNSLPALHFPFSFFDLLNEGLLFISTLGEILTYWRCVCMCMYVCVCMRVYVCVCMRVYVCMYVYVCVCMCVYVCVFSFFASPRELSFTPLEKSSGMIRLPALCNPQSLSC